MTIEVIDRDGRKAGVFPSTADAVAWAHKHLPYGHGDGEREGWDLQVPGANVVRPGVARQSTQSAR